MSKKILTNFPHHEQNTQINKISDGFKEKIAKDQIFSPFKDKKIPFESISWGKNNKITNSTKKIIISLHNHT